MTAIAECLKRSEELLSVSDSAELDIQILLAYCVAQSRTFLMTWPERELTATQLSAFDDLVERRKEGEPIAYLIEQQGFWSLDLRVLPTTLIPRPETELLVEQALAFLSAKPQSEVLDLGTGTGAIALAMAKELPEAKVLGVDINHASIALAKDNAARNNIGNVSFKQSSWYTELAGLFDLIISNPPYIRTDDPHLSQGDVRFEPVRALVAGTDGLADLRIIIREAPVYLQAGGALMVEHGYDQKHAVSQLFKQSQFVDVSCYQDLAGQDRITVGIKG
ncbi:MAG: peptide chain release factor N(5)-glutamine methyltransferase [Sinobacterium sp.]